MTVDIKEDGRFLVIPNAGLGDYLFALQTGYKLKVLYPQAEISYLSWTPVYRKIFEDLKFIQAIIDIETPRITPGGFAWKKKGRENREILRDVIASSDFIVWLNDFSPVRALISQCGKRALHAKGRMNPRYPQTRNLFTAISFEVNKALGLWRDWHPLVPPALCQPELDFARDYRRRAVPKERMAFLSPGSNYHLKVIPPAAIVRAAAFVRAKGFQPVLLLPMERGSKESYLSAFPPKNSLLVLDNLELRQVLALIRVSDLFIGPDSGLTHAAAFFSVPTIAVIGPSPDFFAPYGRSVAVVNVAETCVHRQRSCNCEESCLYQSRGGRCLDQFFDPAKLAESWAKLDLF